MKNYSFYLPTKVLFGRGQLSNLHKQTMPGSKALLLISNGRAMIDNGYLARVQAELDMAGVAHVIFAGIEPNPFRKTVMKAADFAKVNGCDFIVALGGGSVMDAAKAIAMMVTNEGDLWDYVGGGSGKGLPLVNDPIKLICITTTAGTGSEVDEWGVITHEELHEKIGVGGYESLFPQVAIVDAELMLTVPPRLTAYQGFDAFFHCGEVYLSTFSNAMSDMVALDAIEHIARYLPIAVNNGKDIDAREHVAYGNTMAGYAMVAGCTMSEHSLEHAMSAYHTELPHGAGLIMISLAYYQHFIDAGVEPHRFVRMAQAMGMKNATKPEDFITALRELQRDCGVDSLRMSDYGITTDELEKIANNAKYTMAGLFAADPIDLSIEDCVNILTKSYK